MLPLIAQLVEQLALNETVLGSSPSKRTCLKIYYFQVDIFTNELSPAQVVELVDTLVLGTSAATRGGSSPLLGT